MCAKDVVLVEGLGADTAKNAGEFNLASGGHVYVGDASSDPVAQFSNVDELHIPGTNIVIALGSEPARDGNGSTRFEAEIPGFMNPIGDRQLMLPTRNREPVFSISDITSRPGDALGHDGHDRKTPRHRVGIDTHAPSPT